MKRALILLLFAGAAHAQLSRDLSWLPPKCKAAATTHVYVTPWLPYHFLGWYNKRSPAILLLVGYNDADLSHEVGHAVWYRSLSWREHRRWAHIHWSHPNLNAVFIYPNDPRHSFAEAFSDYVSRPRVLLRNDPDVYTFFRELIGKEYL